MLFYCPLESIPERYTYQMSAPRWGWFEKKWEDAGVYYQRVDGLMKSEHIKNGSVVDAVGRAHHCSIQTNKLLAMAEQGWITKDDVIYFDDFWHPGLEALPYAFHLLGRGQPKMFSYCWAQSYDQYDFTARMGHWMRAIENAYMRIYDGVFVACPTMHDLIQKARHPLETSTVHTVGLPFDSEEVAGRMYGPGIRNCPYSTPDRQDRVVFSSRWDEEKNPLFFLDVIQRVHARRPDVQFVVCTSAPKLRSNNPPLLRCLQNVQNMLPSGTLVVRECLSKADYYDILATSKIQFNCASQDFVSFTLLEASVAGCYPIYPAYRSFPETFKHQPQYMYRHGDVADAAQLVLATLDRGADDHWSQEAIESRQWIHQRFDRTWERMARIMGVLPEGYQCAEEASEASLWS